MPPNQEDNMEKGSLDVKYFLDTASLAELKEFHDKLARKNHDNVFDALLGCLTSMMEEKRSVLV